MIGRDASAGILELEPWLRLGLFVTVLAGLALWEVLAPRRDLSVARAKRWPGNVGLVLVDTLLVRILFPTAAVGVAILAEARGWGVLNLVTLPEWVAILIAVVLLDLIIYAQHVLFHLAPWLW